MSDQIENASSDQPGTGATLPPDSTIPSSDTGVAAGYTGEPSTFEPEEEVPVDGSGNTGSGEAAASQANTGEATAGETDSGGTGQRSREATGMDSDDLSVFQSHWDEFPGHTD